MKISLYIAKEVLLYFLLSFLFFFLIFFLNQILYMADKILAKNAPLPDVIFLIIFSLPSLLALSAPFGALMGGLLSIGRLCRDHEILAARACGISHAKLFFPAFFLGVLFSLFSFFANDILLPIGTINFNKATKKLLLSAPKVQLGSRSVSFYKDSLIVTGDVLDDQIKGLIIIDKTSEREDRVLYAKKAQMDTQVQQGVIGLQLVDVTGLVTNFEKQGTFDYFTAEQLQYNILLTELSRSIKTSGPREKTSFDLGIQIAEKERKLNSLIRAQKMKIQSLQEQVVQAFWRISSSHSSSSDENADMLFHQLRELERLPITDETLESWKIEFYQKFSIPLACLCFIILTYPLAVVNYRRGFTLILGLGLLISVLYWTSLLVVRRFLVQDFHIPPEFALFMPNILSLIVGIGAFLRLRR